MYHNDLNKEIILKVSHNNNQTSLNIKTILVTGGAGYIGSHVCVELLNHGYQVVVIDDLSNSSSQAIQRIETITQQKVTFYTGSVADENMLADIFAQHQIYAVIHLAGLKAVGESVKDPLKYYSNNVAGAITLLKCMRDAKVYHFIFSSSASVYGTPQFLPYTEQHPLSAVNPYGRTKQQTEDLLRDLAASDPAWHVSILRYFNPIGAHPSGLIGENPNGIPDNLMPFITQVAVGRLPHLNIWGDDYPTVDGTGVRDYIHVVDLAKGHVAALNHLHAHSNLTVNLGTGRGTSVLELVNTFRRVNEIEIPYQIKPRRPGDLPEYYASADLAKQLLNWEAEKTIEEMCIDTWRWQKQNPNGYAN